MNDVHEYAVTVTWTGNGGTGTSGYRDYSRSFELEAGGRHSIAGSSDPAFRGDEDRWNPEQLLIGSLAACHKLWFLHLAAVAGVIVVQYVDRAEGTMRTTAGAETGCFEQVTLHPEITLASPIEPDMIRFLHEDAHRRCFIANSVNFPVRIEGSVYMAGEQKGEMEHYGR